MIKVRFTGQLGNQLFCYCMGKILALRTGMLFNPPAHFVDKRGQPVRWSLDNPLFIMNRSEGRRDRGDWQNLSPVHWMDLDAIDSTRPISLMSGYFQRYELLQPYKDRLRQAWLPIRNYLDTDDDGVYVHVRRSDYVNGNPDVQCVATELDEYAACLEHFPDAKRIHIVTDDPRDPFHTNFHKFGIPYDVVNKPWDHEWLLLASCTNMIMSQSTYSWWAGLLGRAEKIVCPVFPGSHWHKGLGITGAAEHDYPNLQVTDEERWIWLTDKPSRSDADSVGTTGRSGQTPNQSKSHAKQSTEKSARPDSSKSDRAGNATKQESE